MPSDPNERRTGRPPLGETPTVFLGVKTTEAEREEFKRVAAEAGLTLSDWVRQTLRKAAKRKRRG